MDHNKIKISELYNLCRTYKIKNFKKMSKQNIIEELTKKNLLRYRNIVLKPG